MALGVVTTVVAPTELLAWSGVVTVSAPDTTMMIANPLDEAPWVNPYELGSDAPATFHQYLIIGPVLRVPNACHVAPPEGVPNSAREEFVSVEWNAMRMSPAAVVPGLGTVNEGPVWTPPLAAALYVAATTGPSRLGAGHEKTAQRRLRCSG